jgi:glycosyltransferase involved in cell wall biosynthesis
MSLASVQRTVPPRPRPPREVALVYHSQRGSADAILAYTRRLAAAMDSELDGGVRLITRVEHGPWTVADGLGNLLERHRTLVDAAHGCRSIVLQYNPFSYARWGLAPWLVRDVVALQRKRSVERLAIMVHEAFVAIEDARSALMGSWQRTQIALLLAASDLAFASTGVWAQRLSRMSRHEVQPLPVGSNLPDRRADRDATRHRLGVSADDLVLSTFGTGHPSKLMQHVVQAANAAARDRPVALLNLGYDADRALPGLAESVRLVVPGEVSDEELACHLAASDVFLIPLADGVSSRRTSLTGALQHAVPIVGTFGINTDPWLMASSAALRLTPIAPLEAFAEAVAAIAAGGPDQARAQGTAARTLYEQRFAWDVIARDLAAALAAS